MQSLHREFSVAVGDGPAPVPGHRIDDVGGEAMAAAEGFEAMPPGMAWGQPLILDAEQAHPFADDPGSIAASAAEAVRRQPGE